MRCAHRLPRQHWLVALVVASVPAVSSAQTVRQFQPAVPEGGRAGAIAVHPQNDSELLVASELGGLFRTQDRGATWAHVDGLRSWLVTDVEYAPLDPRVIIAATQDDFLKTSRGRLWRTIDGGAVWTQMAAFPNPVGPTCPEPDRTSVYSVSFEPYSDLVVAATDCGLTISRDRGLTWSHTVVNSSAPPWRHGAWSVLAAGSGRVYAAARDGIGRSPDRGLTWQVSAGPSPSARAGVVHAFAVSPFNVDHVYLVSDVDGRGNVLSFSSDGGATWTEMRPGGVEYRPGFVRTAASASTANEFDVFFGNGIRLWRARFRNNNPNPPSLVGAWQRMDGVDHADPGDIAFSHAHVPILVGTDGGVHVTSDGGTTWTQTGGGSGGYNALQITEVTGQLITGAGAHADLYYGTQDNRLVASRDGGATWPDRVCCEGFFIQAPRRHAGHSGAKVTGQRCGDCSNFLSDAHFVNVQPWPEAPDGDSIPNDPNGTPCLIEPSTYLQMVINDDADPPAISLLETPDYGATWTSRGPVPRLRRVARVGGIATPAPVVYSGIARPEVNLDGSNRLGLVRIDNIRGTGNVTVRDADGGGLAVATFTTMFAQYPVFAASPHDSNYLWAADVHADGMMKYSLDGGLTWSSHADLTSRVTEAGTYRFSLGHNGRTIVSAIAWNPENRCDILVGTRQTGVFRSANGGRTWSRVDGSTPISNVSTFFFVDATNVLVSTYGRGLWKLQLSPAAATCGGPATVLPPRQFIDIWTPNDIRMPFKIPGDRGCPECTYLIVNWGEITDLGVKDGALTRLAVSGGVVRHVDASLRALPLPVEIGVKTLAGRPQLAALPPGLQKAGVPIRGLMLAEGRIRGFIAGERQPDAPEGPPPTVELGSPRMRGGDVMLVSGEPLTVNGSGFARSGEDGTVTVTLDGEPVADAVKVGDDGRFRLERKVNSLAGEHVIEVLQRGPMQLRIARASFNLVGRDQGPDAKKEPE